MQQYRYGMKERGFSPGAQPMEGFVERQDDPTGEYYDILVYDRILKFEEVSSYDLRYLDKSES